MAGDSPSVNIEVPVLEFHELDNDAYVNQASRSRWT
jgi:hypothetical protein